MQHFLATRGKPLVPFCSASFVDVDSCRSIYTVIVLEICQGVKYKLIIVATAHNEQCFCLRGLG